MPLCKCHGVPKRWGKDDKCKSGGTWRCIVKRREAWKRYKKSPKGQAVNRAAWNRYDNSEHGRAARAAYYQNLSGLRRQKKLMDAWLRVSQQRLERLEKELNG